MQTVINAFLGTVSRHSFFLFSNVDVSINKKRSLSITQDEQPLRTAGSLGFWVLCCLGSSQVHVPLCRAERAGSAHTRGLLGFGSLLCDAPLPSAGKRAARGLAGGVPGRPSSRLRLPCWALRHPFPWKAPGAASYVVSLPFQFPVFSFCSPTFQPHLLSRFLFHVPWTGFFSRPPRGQSGAVAQQFRFPLRQNQQSVEKT